MSVYGTELACRRPIGHVCCWNRKADFGRDSGAPRPSPRPPPSPLRGGFLRLGAIRLIHLAHVAGFKICPSNVRVQPRHELVAIAPVRSNRHRPLLRLEMVAEGFDGCLARAGPAL